MRGTGTATLLWHLGQASNTVTHMTRFRFVTPHRHGKWYPDLKLAQRFAAAIGAGYLDQRSGEFVAYRDVRLETSSEADSSQMPRA